jgi:hypothetical protein
MQNGIQTTLRMLLTAAEHFFIFKNKKTFSLTLIPTGETTSGPHCFRAKYLGIFLNEKNLQKIA